MCRHTLCWAFNYMCMHLNLSDLKINVTAVVLHFAWFFMTTFRWRFNIYETGGIMKPWDVYLHAAFVFCRVCTFNKHENVFHNIFLSETRNILTWKCCSCGSAQGRDCTALVTSWGSGVRPARRIALWSYREVMMKGNVNRNGRTFSWFGACGRRSHLQQFYFV